MATAWFRRVAVALTAAIACADLVAGGVFLLRPERVQAGTSALSVPIAVGTATATTPSPRPSTTLPPPPHGPADTVWIPSQKVRAPIDVCDIVNKELEPPRNVHHTCYWAGGAALSAQVGTTIVTGHVNWVGQGTGALGNIGKLRPGDLVRTTGKDGVVATWEVQKVVHRPKSDGIDTSVFVGASGPRRLYLITCGGAFDTTDANYLDNIYVEAVPLQGLTSSPVG